MTDRAKNLITALAIIAALILAGLYFSAAQASGCCKTTNNTTNIYNPASMTIIEGVDDKDLAEGLAAGAAAGSHQFDYSVKDYQASITGAFIDSSDAVSFGIAKRWEKVDALFHGSYTRVLDNDHLWVIGGTFRF